MKTNITPKAKRDIAKIGTYIKIQLCNPDAAIRIVARIRNKIDRILEFPEKGVPIGHLVEIDTNYRFVVCGNYKIFYRREGRTIFVDRVLHNKQDYMKILFGKKKRS